MALTATLVVAKGRRRAAPAPVWNCGQQVVPSLLWTSAGFTKPLRLVLEGALRPTRAVLVDEKDGVLQRLRYRSSVSHVFETAFVGPARRLALAGAAVVRRLQSGNLGDYVVYLLALVIVLLLVGRLGLLG
jgi:hydrogenase-4 component B